MGQWLNVGVSLLVGLMCTTAVRADETAKKIQQAVKKIEGSVVGVRYSRDMSGLADITRERGGRGGNWLARIGRPRVTPGIIVNDKGFIVVPAEITRDPTRGWFGRQGGRSGSSGGSTLKELIVIMPDGSERKARLTGRDSRRGMAFIQLDDASGIKPVELAGKKDVSLADQVIVVAPLSDDNAETMRFLLTRINAIVGGEKSSYSVMDDLSPYEGGIVMNMKGDVIGMVGRPPRGEGSEEDAMMSGVRRFVGGRATGLRVLPAASLEHIFAEPPTALLSQGEDKDDDDDDEPEEKKDDEKKKPDDDY